MVRNFAGSVSAQRSRWRPERRMAGPALNVFEDREDVPHSHPFDLNAVRSTPGGAYHPPVAYLAPSCCAISLLP